MILGFTPFTFFHVAISIIGIAAGVAVVYGLLTSRRLNNWTAVFLVTTVLTNATGFGFPFFQVLPSHIIGAVSLVVLAAAVVARYPKHLVGPWRGIYAVGAVTALYLNLFVFIVQLFRRVPALAAAAPTQSEAPFAIAQGVVLLAFVWLGALAFKRFRPDVLPAARHAQPVSFNVPQR
jgi:hypothetical protein